MGGTRPSFTPEFSQSRPFDLDFPSPGSRGTSPKGPLLPSRVETLDPSWFPHTSSSLTSCRGASDPTPDLRTRVRLRTQRLSSTTWNTASSVHRLSTTPVLNYDPNPVSAEDRGRGKERAFWGFRLRTTRLDPVRPSGLRKPRISTPAPFTSGNPFTGFVVLRGRSRGLRRGG